LKAFPSKEDEVFKDGYNEVDALVSKIAQTSEEEKPADIENESLLSFKPKINNLIIDPLKINNFKCRKPYKLSL
jgi:hypothetical protein